MNKILDLVANIKGQLKESITTELTPEEINKVASIDKSLDDLTEQVTKLQKDYDDLKDSYIEEFGNGYSIPSPKNTQLMNLFRDITSKNGILNDNQKIFEYISEFPQRSRQSKLI